MASVRPAQRRAMSSTRPCRAKPRHISVKKRACDASAAKAVPASPFHPDASSARNWLTASPAGSRDTISTSPPRRSSSRRRVRRRSARRLELSGSSVRIARGREGRTVEVAPRHRHQVAPAHAVLHGLPGRALARHLIEHRHAGETPALSLGHELGKHALGPLGHEGRAEKRIGGPPAGEDRHLELGDALAHRDARRPVGALLGHEQASPTQPEMARRGQHELGLEERVGLRAARGQPTPGALGALVELLEGQEAGAHGITDTPSIDGPSNPFGRSGRFFNPGRGAAARARAPGAAPPPPATRATPG